MGPEWPEPHDLPTSWSFESKITELAGLVPARVLSQADSSHLPAATPCDLALCLWGRETESETEKEGDRDRDTETEIQRQTETWRDRE